MFDWDSLLSDLPPPRADEPPTLRQSIAEELTDHLLSAFRRERVLSTDDATAWQRVLAEFGNPQRVAFELWWQAMKGRIVGQRIFWSVQTTIAIAVLITMGLMLRSINQLPTAQRLAGLEAQTASNQALLAQVLQRLPEPPVLGDTGGGGMGPGGGMMMGAPGGMGAGAVGMMPGMPGGGVPGAPPTSLPGLTTLVLEFREGTADGPPVKGLCVRLESLEPSQQTDQDLVPLQIQDYVEIQGYVEDNFWFISFKTNTAQNLAARYFSQASKLAFPNVRPGRYALHVRLDSNLYSRQAFVIPRPSDAPVRRTIVCPPVSRDVAQVRFQASPLPELTNFKPLSPEDELVPVVELVRRPTELNGLSWIPLPRESWSLCFDRETGEPQAEISGVDTHLADSQVRYLPLDAFPIDDRNLTLNVGEYDGYVHLTSRERLKSMVRNEGFRFANVLPFSAYAQNETGPKKLPPPQMQITVTENMPTIPVDWDPEWLEQMQARLQTNPRMLSQPELQGLQRLEAAATLLPPSAPAAVDGDGASAPAAPADPKAAETSPVPAAPEPAAAGTVD
jgi:hypothetical protein